MAYATLSSGCAGILRRFIEGFATIAEPLTRLTRKETKFVWSSEADEAFARLKTAMLVKVSAAAPMDLVTIDILSGLPQATDGSTCIIVAVDYMTKWAEAYALPNEEASTCMDALYNGFFARFGMPN